MEWLLKEKDSATIIVYVEMKFLVLFLVVSLLAVNCDLNCIPVVLEGYDVIEYYRMEQDSCNSVLGLSNFTYNLESNDEKGDLRVYQFWFSSQSNLDHFREDPWKYAPKFGGFCSFGVCCETEEDGWPWEDSHLGPPAGPDPKKCGFRVYNHALYFDIDNKHDETFFSDADNNIKLGMVLVLHLVI